MWNPGHGGKDPGAVNSKEGLREKDIVLKIVKYAMSYLSNNYTGFEQRSTRLDDTFTELSKLDDAADAWGADIYISVHVNAGGGNGYESYIPKKPGNPSASIALQNVFNSEILTAMKKFGDIKAHGNDASREANFAVLVNTNMPALLTENLYIDSSDVKYLKNEDFIKAVGEAHARGAAKFLGLRLKPTPKPVVTPANNTLYKVQVGAFAVKQNAEQLAKELKAKGFDAFIIEGVR